MLIGKFFDPYPNDKGNKLSQQHLPDDPNQLKIQMKEIA